MGERRFWPGGHRSTARRPPTQAQLSDLWFHQNRRLAGQLLEMIAENKRLVENLNQEIRAEEFRTGVFDRKHFTYSTVAKAAVIRRDNLLRSIDTLRLQLQQVENALAEAVQAQASGDGLQLSTNDAA